MPDTNIDFGLLAGAGAPVRSFKAGDVIFREGDPAEELFIVKPAASRSGSATGCWIPCLNAAFSAKWP